MISLNRISKRYGKHKVLEDVTMDIYKGDIFGLIGKNGAGKTTMFKVILGLSEFEQGELKIGDEGDSLEEGRKKIGFLIGSNFFPYMNARQNLQYSCRMQGIKEKSEIDRVLKIVGLDGVKKKFRQYSLGMKQRLGIANAILGNPEILILDEPTNGLDPQGIADIHKLVQKLNEEYLIYPHAVVPTNRGHHPCGANPSSAADRHDCAAFGMEYQIHTFPDSLAP